MRLLLTSMVLVSLVGCGSATPESSEPPTSVAGAAITTTATGATTTTTTSPPATTTTAAFDPLANLPEVGPAPFARTTRRIEIDALPIEGDDALAMDRVIDHLGFYASSYVPVDSSFVRYRSTVGQGFSSGVFVTETLAVNIQYSGTANELADVVANQIAATVTTPVEWETYRGFPNDVTFGRTISPTPLTRAVDLPAGLLAFALASPPEGDADTFTLYVHVAEGHPDHDLSDVARPPVVDSIEHSLTTEWAIEEPWRILDWEYSLYLNDETGEVEPGLLFDVWFEAPAEQLYQSLLATGSWSEHPDFPPEDRGFWLYSATAWMQAQNQGENTNAVVTANP